jgi:hypothetical protein
MSSVLLVLSFIIPVRFSWSQLPICFKVLLQPLHTCLVSSWQTVNETLIYRTSICVSISIADITSKQNVVPQGRTVYHHHHCCCCCCFVVVLVSSLVHIFELENSLLSEVTGWGRMTSDFTLWGAGIFLFANISVCYKICITVVENM